MVAILEKFEKIVGRKEISMISKDFEGLVKNVFSNCEKMLNGTKKDEYAGEEDRLRNFKTGAAQRQTIPEDYLLGVKAKQTASISDMVKDLKSGKEYPLMLWQEKISDEINYHVLLLALLVERFEGFEDRDEIERKNAEAARHRDKLNFWIQNGRDIFFNTTDIKKKIEICCVEAFVLRIRGYDKVLLRAVDGSILEHFVAKE